MKTPHALLRFVPAALPLLGACETAPSAPVDPTWADVEPILRAECNHCHGGSAPLTAAIGAAFYRLDFYDMTPESCGEAGVAMDAPALARANAGLIKADITRAPGVVRPRMPPAPGPVLQDWQRDTLLRWADRPVKGVVPTGNLPPRVDVRRFPASADQKLEFVAVLNDPDGQSSVGIIKVRDLVLKMGHPGSFAFTVDTAAWPAGSYKVTAVTCDGWVNASHEIGDLVIKH